MSGRAWRVAALAAAGLAGAAILGPASRRATGPATERQPTIVSDDALLLRGSPATSAAALDEIRGLGADWVGVTGAWGAIAPASRSARRPGFDAADPGAYPPGAWAGLDRVTREAGRRGLKVMIVLAGRPPRWARTGGHDFAAFAAAAARRYSGRSHGLPAAVAFVIGDEPNQRLGDSEADADRYRALLYAGVAAVRGAAPGSLVLVGNTSGTHAPLRFLRRLACLTPAGRPSRDGPCARFRPLPGDGWAHHPHWPGPLPWSRDADPENAGVADLRRLTSLLERLHALRRLAEPMALYVTATAPRAPAPYDQARALGEAEWLVRRTPDVRGFAQAPLRDPFPGAAGLELPDGRPKPALGAFAHVLVVHRTGRHRVVIWGRVRPPGNRGRYRISVRLSDGSWRPLPQFNRSHRTGDGGYFELEARTAPGGVALEPRSAFRLELFRADLWRPAGLPIFGASRPAGEVQPRR